MRRALGHCGTKINSLTFLSSETFVSQKEMKKNMVLKNCLGK